MEFDLLYVAMNPLRPMMLLLLKTCLSILLVALGKVLTMGPGLPEGYEDEGGFHFGAARVRRFE